MIMGQVPVALDRRQARLAAISSVIGTTIEWYDFFIYGTMAALVFPELFFPSTDPFVSLIQSFATFFVGFIARPLGAAFFGYFGDRVGRKSTLVVTLLLMGGSTVLIGLLPTYHQIGVWAPLLLIVMRIIQGLAIGGEWGGAVLLAMEWGQRERRGFMASLPQMGAPFGLILSSAATSLFLGLTGDAFDVWGWRLPFLLSVLLIIIGLYIRVNVLETPYFQKVARSKGMPKFPILEVISKYPRQVAAATLSRVVSDVAFYIFVTFVISYGTVHLEMEQSLFVNATLVGALVAVLVMPYFGHLSDRYGRKLLYQIGAILVILWAFPYYHLLNTKNTAIILLAVIVSLIIHALMFGPLAALIAENFPTRVRYSGASVSFQLTGIIGGGLAPLIATSLLREYRSSFAISVYLIVVAILSIVATFFLRDRTGEELD